MLQHSAMTRPSVPSNHILSGGPYVMGVVNVTPDSFSDGGKFINHDKAIEHGQRLIAEGADILDIGGESTRPGAIPVDPQEEAARVIPVIEALRGQTKFISVDTRNSYTMRAALKAGANAINDISSLRHDPRSTSIVAEARVPVFLMHMQGDPTNMQKNPMYNNVLNDIYNFFVDRLSHCRQNRIETEFVIIDPGVGFGKSLDHNIAIIRNISVFHDLGVPILLGASRKSFIASISKNEPVSDRLPGSLAAVMHALSKNVQIFRVHDVKETVQAIKIYRAINSPL